MSRSRTKFYGAPKLYPDASCLAKLLPVADPRSDSNFPCAGRRGFPSFDN